MPGAALRLMRTQAETLYRMGGAGGGELVCSNEPGDPPAPRLFLGRTPAGNVWHLRAGLAPALAEALAALLAAEPAPAELAGEPPRCREAALALLAADAPPRDEYRGPAFAFPSPHVTPPAPAATPVRRAEQAAALEPHYPWLAPYVGRLPIAAVVEGGAAVAVCFSSRVGREADEAGLEVHPEHRGRGCGAAAAAAWAAVIAAEGRRPLYSTEWGNLASRGVARRLGLELYGEDWSVG